MEKGYGNERWVAWRTNEEEVKGNERCVVRGMGEGEETEVIRNE